MWPIQTKCIWNFSELFKNHSSFHVDVIMSGVTSYSKTIDKVAKNKIQFRVYFELIAVDQHQ